jgi:hypothetical protein
LSANPAVAPKSEAMITKPFPGTISEMIMAEAPDMMAVKI